jgi:hypothetical protein
MSQDEVLGLRKDIGEVFTIVQEVRIEMAEVRAEVRGLKEARTHVRDLFGIGAVVIILAAGSIFATFVLKNLV